MSGQRVEDTEAVTEAIFSGLIVVPDPLQSIDDQIDGKLPPPDGMAESTLTAGECAERDGLI